MKLKIKVTRLLNGVQNHVKFIDYRNFVVNLRNSKYILTLL